MSFGARNLFHLSVLLLTPQSAAPAYVDENLENLAPNWQDNFPDGGKYYMSNLFTFLSTNKE